MQSIHLVRNTEENYLPNRSVQINGLYALYSGRLVEIFNFKIAHAIKAKLYAPIHYRN